MNAATLPWLESRRPTLPWAGLGVSLVAHGLAAGLLWGFWQAPPWQIQPEPVVLDVRLGQAAHSTARLTPPMAARPPSPMPRSAPPVSTIPTPQATQPAPIPVLVAPPHETPSPAALPAPAPQRTEPVATAQPSIAATPVRMATLPVPVTAPATERPSTPAQATPEAAAEIEHRWHLVLLERLRDMKRYPMAARRLGQEGVVVVEARIAPDGHLEGALVKRGSGYSLLDNDALRLLESAAEAARGQLRPERPTRMEVPIAYRLEQ